MTAGAHEPGVEGPAFAPDMEGRPTAPGAMGIHKVCDGGRDLSVPKRRFNSAAFPFDVFILAQVLRHAAATAGEVGAEGLDSIY
jgi:hypothetical protein